MKKIGIIRRTLILSFLLAIISAFAGCDDSGDIIKNELVTVHGRVVNDFGSSISGASVACLYGGTQISTSSSDGSFTLNRIKVPYDLYLVYNGKAVVYKDVKSLAPQLNTFNNASGFDNYCRINLSVPPINPNQAVSAWFVDTTGIVQGDSTCVGNGSISFPVGWQGASVMIGRVMILVYTLDNNGRPLTYDNYGSKPAALVNTGMCTLSFSANDMDIDPGETSINCQLFVPAGTNSIGCALYIGSKSYFNYFNKGFHLFGSDEGGMNYSIVAPDSGSLFMYYLVTNTANNDVYSNKVTNIHLGNSNVNLDNPTILISPSNNANAVDYKTQFSFFSDNNNGVYRTIFSGDSTGTYSLNILSKTPSTTIPDLSFLGVFPDLQKTYSWHVIKYSNLNNIDDFVLNDLELNPILSSVSNSETRFFRFSSNPK